MLTTKTVRIPAMLLTVVMLLLLGACRQEEEAIKVPATLTFPADGETNQPLDVSLVWQRPSVDKEYTYNVYLGKSPDDLSLIASDFRYEYYDDPRFTCHALELNTEYFWKIETKASAYTQDSQVKSFTTTDALPSFAFENSTIMVYPGTYVYTDSIVVLVTLEFAGAASWHDGAANTKAILDYYKKYKHDKEEWGRAAAYCDNLHAYGYSDWYLPAIVELDSVVSRYGLLKRNNDVFISSSENRKEPFLMYTKSGLRGYEEPYSSGNKSGNPSNHKCRCIRREQAPVAG